MHYKTIALELLEQRPQLYEQLRRQRMLLRTIEFYAIKLKNLHEGWKERLAEANPGSDGSQIAGEALEMALKELEDGLPSVSCSEEAERPSPGEFLTVLPDHTPTG